ELNGRPGTDKSASAALKLEIERKGLRSHPGRMECFAGENCKVDKYSTVCFGTNRYSVPDHMIGKMVFAKIYSEGIKLYDDNSMLCHHHRLYERFSWQIDLNHYLVTLGRKPGAIAGSIALKQAPVWLQEMYSDHFVHDARSFIELIQYCQINNIENKNLTSCVKKLARQSTGMISSTHVIALLGNQQQEVALHVTDPDPIAMQSLENLIQLEALMTYN
ncbi:MAG TPA: hypothetical protein VK484_12940, partial [Ferruginibacter sp.]|nr:hypothetical protein [Ferruginibacter sp.]